MFSVMTSITSVDTPVDRRRFCVFKCFCSLLGFMSDDYSFVVAFVVYLFNMDIYLYISMYIQAEYRRFGVFNFLFLFVFVVLRVPLLTLGPPGWSSAGGDARRDE